MRNARALAGATILMAASPAGAAAQAAFVPQPAEARRASETITLDGRLDEADWTRAPALSRFWENYPHNHAEAPEQTEARFLYDDRYLYVGFRLRLTDPSKLRRPFVRRDKVGSTHDYVQVYLDPQGSGQTSTLFRVNVRGTQTDGVQDEAKLSESTDPDFEWDVRSAIVPDGWTSEIRIPLSTLRVSRRGAQTWKVIVTRGVPRSQNTQMATAPWPHDGNCFLCLASQLSFPDLTPAAERLIIEPSVASTLRRDKGSFGTGTHLDPEPGLDAKWLPYGGAAVDLTINPDFSQVEADSPQLTANQRFAINLPEKRPFFREASDLIGTPLPILYTRTITAPDYGLRFTHRSASVNGTLFLADDGGRGLIIEPGLLSSTAGAPETDAKVGFAHLTDHVGRSLIGALGAFKINDDGSYNALGGLDLAWQNSSDRVTGQILTSQTTNPDRPDLVATWRGQKLSGIAGVAEWSHASSLLWTARYTRYDPGFRSWLGFVPRVGYNAYHAALAKPHYLSSRWLNRISPYASYDRLDAIDRAGHEQDAALGIVLSGLKALSVDASWHPGMQLLTEQGQMRQVSQIQWTSSIQPGPRLPLIAFNGYAGRAVDFANGDTVPVLNLSATLRTRPMDRLEIEGRYSILRLGGANGGEDRLRETIPELLVTWHFGAALHVLGDLQLHRSTRRFPNVDHSRSSLASIQFVWEPSIDWHGYFGARSGRVDPLDPAAGGRSTEIYLKLTRRFGIRT
jgi:hypothetical protein